MFQKMADSGHVAAFVAGTGFDVETERNAVSIVIQFSNDLKTMREFLFVP
jgi:hypothetical protein